MPSPLVEVADQDFDRVRVLVKRDDLTHPRLPGNKWRKLKYQFDDARTAGAATLLTFGGAYSNHIRAVAAAGQLFGFDTIGVIRGEERPFNDGLAAAVGDGMRLHYLDRATYRRKNDPELHDALIQRFRDQHGIALEWIYVAKAMLGLCRTIAAGEITPGSTVVFVVTGPTTTPQPQTRSRDAPR